MQFEVITQRDDLLIRRQILQPGEALPWHVDLCHRFTVVVRGEQIRIEFRESGETLTLDVHPGLADWDAPEPQVHRGVNIGTTVYEEVVTFYLDPPNIDPQPVQS
jgi:hypothetical protein